MATRNHYNILLISFAIVLLLAAGIKETWAYFTTYAEAKGGYPISLGYETEIKEKVSDWTKVVTISNKSGSQPVYIRVKAFCGSEFNLDYSGSNWSKGTDDYWYYNGIVYGGSVTEELSIKINNIPEDVEDSAEFNVVVIYESTLVRYDEAGAPYADWSATLDSGRTEGGI